MSAAMDMAKKIAQWPEASIKYSKRAMRMAVASEIHKDAVDEGWKAIMGAMAEH